MEVSNKCKGIAFLMLSGFSFTIMNLFVRLSGDLPVVQKSFFRNLVAGMLVLIFLLYKKERFHFYPLKDLVIRSVAGTLGILANFYAVSHLALADASMLSKLSPFFALLFSVFILKERLKPQHIILIIAAFLVSMLVIKPSFTNLLPLPALAGFLGGMCAGLAYTFVRKLRLAGTSAPNIVFFFALFSTCATFPLALLAWETMLPLQVVYLLLAGCFAFGGQIFITHAYSYAPAKEISIFDYGQVIYAMFISLAVWGEWPDIWSIVAYVLLFVLAYIHVKYT